MLIHRPPRCKTEARVPRLVARHRALGGEPRGAGAKGLGLSWNVNARVGAHASLESGPVCESRSRMISTPIVLDSFNLAAAERRLCELALEAGGNLVGGAKLLGLTRHAFKRRLLKHGIVRPDARVTG